LGTERESSEYAFSIPRRYNPSVNNPPPTTADLIREWKLGDVEGSWERIFQTLFERYGHRVYLFFQRKRFSPADCHDLTQDTFFSVFKGLKELRQEETFEKWLFTIAHNHFLSRIEQNEAQKRKAIVVSIDHPNTGNDEIPPLATRLEDNHPDPLRVTLNREKLERLRAALNQLPEQMNRCAYLRFVKGFSYHETAAFMGISEGAVKAHLNQARSRLREQLRGYFDDSDLGI
jgi:RNA polymerase sigma-70 factor (ECF subfamily)